MLQYCATVADAEVMLRVVAYDALPVRTWALQTVCRPRPSQIFIKRFAKCARREGSFSCATLAAWPSICTA